MAFLKKFLLLLSLTSLVLASVAYTQTDSSESENDFFQTYLTNKASLSEEAPFDNNLENFAQYHDVLLSVIKELESSKIYEDQFPVEEGVISHQYKTRSINLFNLMINEVTASEKGALCFFGGWPSRILDGKCQSPWKNKDDEELKKLGNTYTFKFNCGERNQFRCNPLLFGPGRNGFGICVKFKSVSEISDKCFQESRDQIEKIYDAFKTNLIFRKNYLAMVDVMRKFCNERSTYPACDKLTLQVDKMAIRTCGKEFDLNKLTSIKPIDVLSIEVKNISQEELRNENPPKAIVVFEETPLKAKVVKEEGSVEVAPENKSKLCMLYKKFIDKGVPSIPLKQTLAYYNENKSHFPNERYISFSDYSQNSSQKRFYLLDLETGELVSEKISHGSGKVNGINEGDTNHDGILDKCTHSDGSRQNMTRPGFYKVENFYASQSHKNKWPILEKGTNYNGMRLVGLSQTNDDALGLGVVMHEAPYNSDSESVMGRSFGCPAFAPGKGGPIMDKIRGGSLFYAYAPSCSSEMKKVLNDPKLKAWENICK